MLRICWTLTVTYPAFCLRVQATTIYTKEASAHSVLFATSKEWTRYWPTDSRCFWSSIWFKKLNDAYIFSSHHNQGMYKELTPCLFTCVLRHAFNAIISSTYRSHSPIASDTCYLEAGGARKFIIGKGLKLSMLLNSDLVLHVLQFHVRPTFLNVSGSITCRSNMLYNLQTPGKRYIV